MVDIKIASEHYEPHSQWTSPNAILTCNCYLYYLAFSLVQTFTQAEDTPTINIVTASMVKMSFIVNQSTIYFYLQ
jgi:hypothetical protein